MANHSLLRKKRRELDVSQEALAEKAGITRQTVARLERSGGAPHPLIQASLASALGCKVEELFPSDVA